MDDGKEKEKEKEKDSAILSHLLFMDDEISNINQQIDKLEERTVLLEHKIAWIKNDCFEFSKVTEPKIQAKDKKGIEWYQKDD